MDNIKTYFKQLKFETLIAAVIMIGIGLVFLLLPQQSATVICRIIGGAFALIGLISLISYFTTGFIFGTYSLVASIVCIVFAVLCFVRPEFLSSMLTLLLGILLVVDGVVKFSDGLEVARTKSPSCIVLFIFAIAAAVFGCLILFGKFGTVTTFMGISLIISGAFNLIVTLFFSGRIHKAQKRFRKYEREMNAKTVDSTAEEKKEQ